MFEFAPGILRPITAIGSQYAMDDLGQVAFCCDFADGSRGIYLWKPKAVPEPGTLAMVISALAVCLGIVMSRVVRTRGLKLLALAACGWQVLAADGSALEYSTVALLGKPAPGMPAGVRHAAGFGPAQINAAGEVAFRGDLMGPGIHSDSDSVVWVGQPGSLQIVAREGDAADGTDAGVCFASMPASFGTLNDSALYCCMHH